MSETYEEMMHEEVDHECAKAYQAGRESMREEAAGVAQKEQQLININRSQGFGSQPASCACGRIAKAIREID